jgi:hypothetical protein
MTLLGKRCLKRPYGHTVLEYVYGIPNMAYVERRSRVTTIAKLFVSVLQILLRRIIFFIFIRKSVLDPVLMNNKSESDNKNLHMPS